MRSPLKHETLVAMLLGMAVLLVAFFGIKQFTSLNAVLWLVIADGLWMLVCWQLWQRLDLNRADEGAPLYPRLGLANRLTLLRGGLIAMTGGFLFQPQALGQTFEVTAWIPGLLYTLAAILDRLDGFVARRSKQTSLLGSELDTAYDALGLLVAPLLAVSYSKVHWSFLLVSAAYYVFQWGIYWRRTRNLPVYPLLPSMLRRTLAGFQMGFVAVILLPCFQAPATQLIGVAFMIPILLGFLVDWLVVSGRIQSSASNTQFFNRLAQFSHSIFQPLLRALLFVFLLLFVLGFGLGHELSNEFLPSRIFHIALLLAAGMALLGLAGRVGALIALMLVTFFWGESPVNAITAVIIFSSVWLMLLGTGRFSVWQWDDDWVNRRDGEEHA